MNQFEISKKQDEINQINYWDGRVLDLQILFFGDEVHLYLEDFKANQYNLDECWKVSFIGCAEVKYETDVRFRKKIKVKNFAKNYLYTCQDISLEYYEESFAKCTVNLEGLVIMSIVCQNIEVERVITKNQNFFWENN